MTTVDLEGRFPRGRLLPRFIAFGLVILLVVSSLTARLFYLQVLQGSHFATLANDNRIVLQAIPSARGLMYDRNGKQLVTNVPSYVVKVRPSDLPLSQREAVVGQLATLLKMTPTQINTAIDTNPGSRFDLVRVASDVPEDVARIISEESLQLPGVQVSVEARRQYDTGPLLSQLIGYTGAITASDLKRLQAQGYQPDDVIGQAGLEAQYETQLRGTYGLEQIEEDATGRKVGVVAQVRAPVSGDSLQLTIDTKLQQQAQEALQWGLQAAHLTSGVFMVMNPQTGEILASVSLPTYDDNLFAQGISTSDFQKLIKQPGQPLLNHAISEQFPPGSTWKLVPGSGALQDRKITPTTRIQTYPYLRLGPNTYADWNHRGFGPLDIYGGFANSSDTFFYQVAAKLGIDRLAYWASQWGFGALTGVDLPGEVKGIVPSNAWKEEVFGQPIYPGETYLAGIGQSYDAVTPIQLLNAYCALVNGGKLLQPQIVRQVIGPDGNVVRGFTPQLIHKVPVSAANLQVMRVASRMVVTSGHTYNMVDMPIVVAGKSGTAEFGIRDSKGRMPYHNWFVGWVPNAPWVTASDPGGYKAASRTDAQLAFVAFAEQSDTVGNAATEIVKDFLQIHFGIKKDYRMPALMKTGNFYGRD